jgi:aspartyl-tRNA(Asn)/glutamyl-tRNA(Gln) amidotransferase subunit A
MPRGSSLEMVEGCLARISDAEGEGSRAFVEVYAEKATSVARASDVLRANGYAPSPLAGIPLSIKDLLDVAGEVTRAGSRALEDAPPAQRDAPVVQRLKSAGTVLVGRTNMTPFAYSLVGLNSHFGTPGNPWDRNRIPGGSSSGAAVSVADGMAIAAIGSDTVGSIRVPAALCGVVGFKPTQRRVPREGSVPLSTTLDSIGPLANSVGQCAAVFEVIAGEAAPSLEYEAIAGMRLAVPLSPFLDGLDQHVQSAFDRAIRRLAEAGAIITEKEILTPVEVLASEGTRIIQSVEAYAWHSQLLDRRGDHYDAQIKTRIESGRHVEASAYVAMLARRQKLIRDFDTELRTFDALVLPTVPIIAPTFSEAIEHEDAMRSRLLRNTAPFSFLDCCAISIPIQESGAAPVGMMLVARHGNDWQLLALARAVETALSTFPEGH